MQLLDGALVMQPQAARVLITASDRVNVLRDTNERQVPWVNTSLTANFAFNPGAAVDTNDVAQDKLERLEAKHEMCVSQSVKCRSYQGCDHPEG